MKVYRCHKIVEAAKVDHLEKGKVVLAGGEIVEVNHITHHRIKVAMTLADDADPGYLIRYSDGYLSWSPSKAFEDGYTPIEASPP